MNKILKCDRSNECYTEHYFHVVLFMKLHKLVLTFEFMGEILKCDHSNERFQQYF